MGSSTISTTASYWGMDGAKFTLIHVSHHHQSDCHHYGKLYHHSWCLELTAESVQVISFVIAHHLPEVPLFTPTYTWYEMSLGS